MKKIKILKSNLRIREASRIFPYGWKAIKLTETEAMRFNLNREHLSFEDLVKIYGNDRVLQTEEMYDGYIIISLPLKNDIYYLRGIVKKVTDERNVSFVPHNIKEAFKKGYLYDVYYQHNGMISAGSLRYVWSLGITPFEKITTPEEAHQLREKLTNGAITDKVIEITDKENEILLQYLGRDYYDKFFVVCE